MILFGLKFEKELSISSILECAKSGRIPKKGLLNPRCIYKFHGLGCKVIFHDCIVDFDFSPGGVATGFDEFRLRAFLHSIKDKGIFEDLAQKSDLRDDFQALIRQNLIFQPGFGSTSHLFFYPASPSL